MSCFRFTPAFTRRDMLRLSANGFGLLALADLLRGADTPIDPKNPLAVRASHFPPKAKRIIFLFMHGGPSQVDTFDYKPELKKHDNKPYPGEKPRVQFAQTGNLLASPWEFKPGGKCGTLISDLFPHVRDCADDLCVDVPVHATRHMAVLYYSCTPAAIRAAGWLVGRTVFWDGGSETASFCPSSNHSGGCK